MSIFIGGTGSANEFEDYEEGTFSPRLGGTSNYGSYYATGTGSYTKTGSQVTVSIRFNNIDLSNSASGQAMIFNMPFVGGRNPTNGSAGVSTNAAYHSVAQGGDNEHTWYITNNSGAWYGLVSRHNNSWVDFPVSDFHASGVYVLFMGTYFTA